MSTIILNYLTIKLHTLKTAPSFLLTIVSFHPIYPYLATPTPNPKSEAPPITPPKINKRRASEPKMLKAGKAKDSLARLTTVGGFKPRIPVYS